MNFRKLTSFEIEQLEKQNCICNNWNQINISENFDPEYFINVEFSGTVTIKPQKEIVELKGGIQKHTGIYNAVIHNTTIGANCLISSVKNSIANYEIGDDVVIQNVDMISNEGESTFGNGNEISVLDESGGRKILIYDQLSAQIAYMMALYRHQPKLIERLEKYVCEYTREVKSTFGFIGNGTKIYNTGSILNSKLGEGVIIKGASAIKNVSINSKLDDQVEIGDDVIIRNSIIQTGSVIAEGAIITNCFVGQGCEFGKNYSADHSLFFANCQGFHGEACSIFAGPYTVTHHKSTLLIAGMYSFLNAGSGSNQSNHMYKLGPIHHGIVERGSKTTSDSYLLWPSKIGAFTMVMGRHYNNSDTSNMPFSYLIERDDKSWLAPAVNLRSVGTIRDAMKWPRRDKRKLNSKIDCVNFNLLSPFTIQRMESAIETLESLQRIAGVSNETYYYQNTSITSSSLKRGIKLYNIGIDKFLGNSVITRLHNSNLKSEDDLRKRLKPDLKRGHGDWIDLSGLIAPKSEIDRIVDAIINGGIKNLDDLQIEFSKLYEEYYDLEWTWAAQLLERRLGKKIDAITIEDIENLVLRWKSSVVELDWMLYEDAKKEFKLSAMTGFGADGDENTQLADFEMVRGKFENNSFVQEIQSHIERKTRLGNRMLQELEECSD